MEITVFTPTYNRAYIIENLYQSLKKQTCKDFEWIVIDDGSTDNTAQFFRKILADSHDFNIIYKRADNGGKHRAINKGVKIASGRLFFIVDSDDYLPTNSLETILAYEREIKKDQSNQYAGVAGLKATDGGKCFGTSFDGDVLDITYLERNAFGISGDKAEVYYTDILKKYPFPEFENERFIPESVVWNVIAEDGYKLRYFNKITYFCEYLDDGLTKQGNEKYKSIPKGYGLYLSQSIKYGRLKKLNKWEAVFDYYRMFHDSLPYSKMAKNLHMRKTTLYLRLFGMRLYYKLYNR